MRDQYLDQLTLDVERGTQVRPIRIQRELLGLEQRIPAEYALSGKAGRKQHLLRIDVEEICCEDPRLVSRQFLQGNEVRFNLPQQLHEPPRRRKTISHVVGDN